MYAASSLLDDIELLELALENRGEHIGEDVAASLVDPCVLIHLAAQEVRAIGPLFPDDLGAARKLLGALDADREKAAKERFRKLFARELGDE